MPPGSVSHLTSLTSRPPGWLRMRVVRLEAGFFVVGWMSMLSRAVVWAKPPVRAVKAKTSVSAGV